MLFYYKMADCYYDTLSDMYKDALEAVVWSSEELQAVVMDTCECKVKDWVMKLSYDEYVAEMKSNEGVSQEDFDKKYLWSKDDVEEPVVEEPVVEEPVVEPEPEIIAE
tara:strand:- start:466 stop:789 length:324 start_codon:yes stop_codon:yes gene_type:complete